MGNIGKIYSRKRFVVTNNIDNKAGSETESKIGREKSNGNIGKQYKNGFDNKYEKEKNKSKIQIIKLIIILIIVLAVIQ